jgi:hypothetical protein
MTPVPDMLGDIMKHLKSHTSGRTRASLTRLVGLAGVKYAAYLVNRSEKGANSARNQLISLQTALSEKEVVLPPDVQNVLGSYCEGHPFD